MSMSIDEIIFSVESFGRSEIILMLSIKMELDDASTILAAEFSLHLLPDENVVREKVK